MKETIGKAFNVEFYFTESLDSETETLFVVLNIIVKHRVLINYREYFEIFENTKRTITSSRRSHRLSH